MNQRTTLYKSYMVWVSMHWAFDPCPHWYLQNKHPITLNDISWNDIPCNSVKLLGRDQIVLYQVCSRWFLIDACWTSICGASCYGCSTQSRFACPFAHLPKTLTYKHRGYMSMATLIWPPSCSPWQETRVFMITWVRSKCIHRAIVWYTLC